MLDCEQASGVGMADVHSKTGQVTLTVSIDGNWSTVDFVVTLSFISHLYEIVTGIGFPGTSWMSDRLPLFGLSIESIKYGSPGHFSLLGFGDAMKQVKEILIYLLDRDLVRQKMEIENRILGVEARRLELEALRDELLVKLVRQQVTVAKPISVEEMRSFLEECDRDIRHLQRLKQDGNIKSIRLDDRGKGGGELEPV
jgi:hypothetical protein